MNTMNAKMAVDANQSAQLLCQVGGMPPPDITWTSGGMPLLTSNHLNITSWYQHGNFPYKSTLTVVLVTTSDLGAYVCEAANAMGKSSMTFNLTIKSEHLFQSSPDCVRFSFLIFLLSWKFVEYRFSKGTYRTVISDVN